MSSEQRAMQHDGAVGDLENCSHAALHRLCCYRDECETEAEDKHKDILSIILLSKVN